MTQITSRNEQPNLLPAELLSAWTQLNTAIQTNTAIECDRVQALLDWFYTARWQPASAGEAETRAILPGFIACQPPRAAELADVLCYQLIESGQPAAAAELAESVLKQHPEGALRHTHALALLAIGQTVKAIQTLETALEKDPADSLPGEQRLYALLDLARLYQGQGSLFKAIKPAKAAMALAETLGADALLLEAATLLIDQLVEQGGADEAWATLAPHLTNQPSTSQQALWTLAFQRLGEQLSDNELADGVRFFLQTQTPDPLVQLMIRRSRKPSNDEATERDAPQLALLLALAFHAPIDVVAPLAAQLLMRDKDRQHPSAPLIAAASMAVAERPDERSGKRAHWHRDAMIQFISVAKHQGVPEAAVKLWAEDAQLLREHGVIWRAVEQLTQGLEHAPDWLNDALTLARQRPEPN